MVGRSIRVVVDTNDDGRKEVDDDESKNKDLLLWLAPCWHDDDDQDANDRCTTCLIVVLPTQTEVRPDTAHDPATGVVLLQPLQ